MRNHAEPLRRDYESELVDPIQAVDELVDHAISLRDTALREPGRRMPLYALMLLDALDDKQRGPGVAYKTFEKYKPRRAEIEAKKKEMDDESYINKDISTY